MPKITLDRAAFKALASDTRLELLRTLDGKKLSLNDISKETNLNKATLHEHLSKLNEAGLVNKKVREGHKWVYYSLTWKGESLLHPENTKIVVMFSATLISLWAGIMLLIQYVKGAIVNTAPQFLNENLLNKNFEGAYTDESTIWDTADGMAQNYTENIRAFTPGGNTGGMIYQNPIFLYAAIVFMLIFTIVLCISIWRIWENRTPKL